jgi:predicted enzyme related to lactoylglutathione lyase
MLRMGSRPEEFILTKITVGDLRRSFDFYTKVVGLKPTNPAVETEELASTAAFVELGLNQTGSRREPTLLLIRRAGVAPDREAAQMTWIGFKVRDVAAAVARVKAAGLPIVHEATDYEGARFGVGRDPDGYTVEFLQAEHAE